MPTFKDRIFGANVSSEVIETFKKLEGGGLTGTSKDDILSERKPTYKRYLGDRTPFVRMWSAVQVSGSAVDPETKVKTQTKTTKYFVVNDNNEESYSNFDVNKPIKIPGNYNNNFPVANEIYTR